MEGNTIWTSVLFEEKRHQTHLMQGSHGTAWVNYGTGAVVRYAFNANFRTIVNNHSKSLHNPGLKDKQM